MWQNAQGIPSLPDLTHPETLLALGKAILHYGGWLFGGVFLLGLILALFSFATRQGDGLTKVQVYREIYLKRLGSIEQGTFIFFLLILSFFLCSTLANRYHYWEQDKIAQRVQSLSGSLLEQPAPRVRYQVEEPYNYTQQIGDKIVTVEQKQKVDRYLSLSASGIDVQIDQVKNLQDNKSNYLVKFDGTYQVKNTLNNTQEIFFEINPPYNYSLLQNFKVESENQRLSPTNPGNYSFSVTLNPQQEKSFRVTYQAQGGSRWVYNAQQELLTNFRLTVKTSFDNSDFASGIAPTESKINRGEEGVTYTWSFQDNVSVTNPFGIFTASQPIRKTGILPRLLLLSPALFLWWLLLLYLTFPLSLKQVSILSGVYFSAILTLTYLSRLISPELSWGLISLFVLILVFVFGKKNYHQWGFLVCTIAGFLIPVFGFLIPYTGLTLSLSGLLSSLWVVAFHTKS